MTCLKMMTKLIIIKRLVKATQGCKIEQRRDISREEVVALIDQANDIGKQHKRVKKEKTSTTTICRICIWRGR